MGKHKKVVCEKILRVMRSDHIRRHMKPKFVSSICHELTKRSLLTTEIFLFDVGKAKTDYGVNYELLEKIKNRKVVASKYDTTELKFHMPNIVVGFYNEKPDLEELVLDRWQIFKIEKDDLIYVSEKYLFYGIKCLFVGLTY